MVGRHPCPMVPIVRDNYFGARSKKKCSAFFFFFFTYVSGVGYFCSTWSHALKKKKKKSVQLYLLNSISTLHPNQRNKMHLFLTGVLPFLAHDHPTAAAFLTCRHHNFHASIIPEFLSDEERVKSFCETRQQNELEADEETQYAHLYKLFIKTPLMQFSPSLLLHHKDCNESIIKPLLATKYFSRTLQRCSVPQEADITNDLLRSLSKVQSLTSLDLGRTRVIDRELDLFSRIENQHLEIIVNSFPSLETFDKVSAKFDTDFGRCVVRNAIRSSFYQTEETGALCQNLISGIGSLLFPVFSSSVD